MVRIVADPTGQVVPDLKGKLPSRGAYVCPDPGCIDRAARGRLAASLKVPAGNCKPEEIRSLIAQGYHRRVLSLLGQAKKSGLFVSGTTLVEGELRRRPDKRWLGLVAADASGDISEKVQTRLKAASVPYRVAMNKAQLGDALGKSPRSVVLIKDAGISAAIDESLDRGGRVLNKGGSEK
jgi:ribosomal protein L7Ae-like RNA K-turn-binding protein